MEFGNKEEAREAAKACNGLELKGQAIRVEAGGGAQSQGTLAVAPSVSHRIESHRSPFCPVSMNEEMKSNSGKTAY